MIKAGETVLLSEGEYSDYSVIGVFKALKDFDPKKVVGDFLATPNSKYGSYAHEHFKAYLSSEGFIEDVSYSEWHIGSYGKLEIERI